MKTSWNYYGVWRRSIAKGTQENVKAGEATGNDMKRDWSSEFNALPESVRIIGCALEAKVRIQQLIAEKVRLAQRHRESVSEIDKAIDYAEQHLKRLEDAP